MKRDGLKWGGITWGVPALVTGLALLITQDALGLVVLGVCCVLSACGLFMAFGFELAVTAYEGRL